jgi:hypothetical protein
MPHPVAPVVVTEADSILDDVGKPAPRYNSGRDIGAALGQIVTGVGARALDHVAPPSPPLTLLRLSPTRGCIKTSLLHVTVGPTCTLNPPSAMTIDPTMKLALSEARKAATSAISSGCAARPIGAFFPCCARKSRPFGMK